MTCLRKVFFFFSVLSSFVCLSVCFVVVTAISRWTKKGDGQTDRTTDRQRERGDIERGKEEET